MLIIVLLQSLFFFRRHQTNRPTGLGGGQQQQQKEEEERPPYDVVVDEPCLVDNRADCARAVLLADEPRMRRAAALGKGCEPVHTLRILKHIDEGDKPQ